MARLASYFPHKVSHAWRRIEKTNAFQLGLHATKRHQKRSASLFLMLWTYHQVFKSLFGTQVCSWEECRVGKGQAGRNRDVYGMAPRLSNFSPTAGLLQAASASTRPASSGDIPLSDLNFACMRCSCSKSLCWSQFLFSFCSFNLSQKDVFLPLLVTDSRKLCSTYLKYLF